MDVNTAVFLYVLFTLMPMTRTAVPGTFFWKPRVALDLAAPTQIPKGIIKPTAENIAEGKVVIVEGYHAGLTVAALAAAVDALEPYAHLNPSSAFFYNNAYRWLLRHLSLLPDWASGHAGNYVDTHKVWRRRFYYMNYYVPPFLQSMLFFVKKEDWKKEEKEWYKWVKYAEPVFGKYYKYPSPVFDNWNSMRLEGSVENWEASSESKT